MTSCSPAATAASRRRSRRSRSGVDDGLGHGAGEGLDLDAVVAGDARQLFDHVVGDVDVGAPVGRAHDVAVRRHPAAAEAEVGRAMVRTCVVDMSTPSTCSMRRRVTTTRVSERLPG